MPTSYCNYFFCLALGGPLHSGAPWTLPTLPTPLLRHCLSGDWISGRTGVLNEVFVSGLPGLVGLPVYPQRSRSLQHVHALVCRCRAYVGAYVGDSCFRIFFKSCIVSTPFLLQVLIENFVTVLREPYFLTGISS